MFTKVGRPSYANVVSTLALFIALGGVSYAAVTLPANSVSSKQIKRGAVKNSDLGKSAVTGSKVKNGSLLSGDFKPGQLPAGATGAQGLKGDKGDAGTNGTSGRDFTVETTLQPGQTEKGVYSAYGGGPAGSAMSDSISFRVPLSADISGGNVHWDAQGGGVADPTNCPGTSAAPQAAAGHLCLYETSFINRTFAPVLDPAANAEGAGQLGFSVAFSIPTNGASWSYGSWAVTAP